MLRAPITLLALFLTCAQLDAAAPLAALEDQLSQTARDQWRAMTWDERLEAQINIRSSVEAAMRSAPDEAWRIVFDVLKSGDIAYHHGGPFLGEMFRCAEPDLYYPIANDIANWVYESEQLQAATREQRTQTGDFGAESAIAQLIFAADQSTLWMSALAQVEQLPDFMRIAASYRLGLGAKARELLVKLPIAPGTKSAIAFDLIMLRANSLGEDPEMAALLLPIDIDRLLEYAHLVTLQDDITNHLGPLCTLAHLGDRRLLPVLDELLERFRYTPLAMGHIERCRRMIEVQSDTATLLSFLADEIPMDSNHNHLMRWALLRCVELVNDEQAIGDACLSAIKRANGQFEEFWAVQLANRAVELGVLEWRQVPKRIEKLRPRFAPRVHE